MKILAISSHFTHGGLETHIVSQLTELSRMGHELKIMYEESKSSLEYRSLLGKSALPLRAFPKKITGKYDRLIRTILWQMDGYIPDIVHLHPFESIWYGAELARYLNKPFVLTLHGQASLDYLLENPLCSDTLSKVSHIFMVRKLPIHDLFERGALPNRISILPNGVHIEKQTLRQKRSGAIRIALVGRLDTDKLQSIMAFIKLFSATHFYRSNKQNMVIEVIGSGSEFEVVRDCLLDLKCKQVIMRGFILNPIEVHNDYDFIAGMGRVIIESTSKGVPALLIGNRGVYGFLTRQNYNFFHERNFVITNEARCLANSIEFDEELEKLGSAELDVYGQVKEQNNIQDSMTKYIAELTAILR